MPYCSPQVCHELPAAASQAIFKEAFRLLRPGGALAVMVRTALLELLSRPQVVHSPPTVQSTTTHSSLLPSAPPSSYQCRR